MTSFIHEHPAARVVFGAGKSARALEEATLLGQRPMLVYDEIAPGIAPELIDAARQASVLTIEKVRQHVPVEDAVEAREQARQTEADCIVVVGGGSAIGLAKAIALTERLPIAAVPTTYAGSEMTPVYGLSEHGVKTTGLDTIVAPRVVVYDPALTTSLPAATTAASGLNAIAHCVDALWAPGATPLTDVMAERGIATLAASLPRAVAAGQDMAAREEALVGCWLAGATFATAGSSLHHKLCHVLGGRYGLPHAETHAVILPWATRLATAHTPAAGDAIGRALGANAAADALSRLADDLGAPRTLAELGLSEADAVALSDAIDPASLGAPFAIRRDELRELLLCATLGGAVAAG